MWNRSVFGSALAGVVVVVTVAGAAEEPTTTLPQGWADAVRWRSIGPAVMGGRITDLAVVESDPTTWWAATASGGLLKTTNDGLTFTHQFDREATVSIGAVAVAPSNPEILWVGTGEANPRNSVSWGNGVYKSLDGGATWTHMGLPGSFQIGEIVIHPENPEVVWVGALGRLWGPNEERGLYKTTDGGASWRRVLFVDERTGVVDIDLDPSNPDVMLVATYERERDGFDTNDPAKKFGPGSGLWRSGDGGETFERVTEGLPTCMLGRIGIDWYRGDASIVYAVVESEKIGAEPEDAAFMGMRAEDADAGARLTEVTEGGPAAEAGLRSGDIVLEIEDVLVHSSDGLTRTIRRHKAGETVLVRASRDRKTIEVELTFARRPESQEDSGQPQRGGRDFERRGPFGTSLGGQVADVQDQQGEEGHEYGGIYRSEDGGVTWKRVNSLNPRPMYFSEIRVDPSDDQHVYVLGIPLFRSKDGGATFTDDGGGRDVHVDHHAMWIDGRDGRHIILGNDGGIYVTRDRMTSWDHLNHVAIGQFYHATTGPRDEFLVYGGLQDNGSWGGPSATRSGGGPVNEDWFRVGGGDGFLCLVDPKDPDLVYFESQNGGAGRRNLRTGESGFMRPRGPRGTRYRFNWRTPFLLSHHNSGIYYIAGNQVFRSVSQGDGLKSISPEIAAGDRGTATALAESPLDPDRLWVGSDDGALWTTADGGVSWTRLDGEAPEAPEGAADAPEAPAPPRDRGGRGGRGGGAGGPGGGAGGGAGGAGGGGGGGGGEGGGGRGARMLEMLTSQDADGDGNLSRDEVPEQMGRMFDRIDANDDDVIDRAEIRALAERMGVAMPEAAAAEEAPEAAAKADEPEESPKAEAPAAPAASDDPVAGTWTGRTEAGAFTLELTRDGAVLRGQVISEAYEGEIVDGTWDAETGALGFVIPAEPTILRVRATVTGSSMQGTLEAADGLFTGAFDAARPGAATPPAAEPAGDEPAGDEPAAAGDDPISGTWSGRPTDEQMGGAEAAFTIVLVRDAEDPAKVTGTTSSRMGEATIANGRFVDGKLTFSLESDQIALDVVATVEGASMSGTMTAEGGMFSFEFTANRTGGAAAEGGEGEAPAKPEPTGDPLGSLVPGLRYVSGIEPSRHVAGRVYLALDGHRSNDDAPYVFISDDSGATWQSLAEGLPEGVGSVRTIREDRVNPDLLWLGTEFGLYVSIDRGRSWTRFHGNLPTVAIHEVAQHPSRDDVLVATHGRSLWLLDAGLLRQVDAAALAEPLRLFRPAAATYRLSAPSRGGTIRQFVGTNPDDGAEIWYALREDARRLSLRILDAAGEPLREFEAEATAGLHRVSWNLRADAGEDRPQRFRRFGGPRVAPGTYTVELKAGGRTLTAPIVVRADPKNPEVVLWSEAYDERLLTEEQFEGGD